MAPNIGFALLLMTFLISIFLPFFLFVSTSKLSPDQQLLKQYELEKIAKILVILIFSSAFLTQISLIYSFIISDYSVTNVYQNSHHLKPLLYKISGSWGNHEGSMLLLIAILCAYTLAFTFLSNIAFETKRIIIASQSLIIAAFSAFTAFTSNPFLRTFPIPKAGLGLNPVLQDIGLSMHPPMLYTGYIGFSLIFSFAIAGLLTEKINSTFAKHLKNWLLFSWGFLTLGIGLGSWWAYRELGWGGYWFWDPVENISLMPWLAGAALIHCIKFLEKKEIFKIWAAFLSILSFILCLLGIFLTRSGILTSVHSFAIDASRGFFVISLIFLIGGAGLLIFGSKSHMLKSDIVNFHFLSKIGSALVNNYFLILALFIVLLGTIYPIFSQSLFDQFISIGPNYYNTLFTILIIPFLLFLSISCILHHSQKTPHKKLISVTNSIICAVATVLTSLVLYYEKSPHYAQIFILFLAIFAALLTLFTFVKKNPWQNLSQLTMTAAHFGFCLIVAGIILTSSFGITKELNIKENQSVIVENYTITFSKVSYQKGPNFVAREGVFKISKNNKPYVILIPQLRFYPISDQTTNEAAIKSGLFGDLYLALGQKDENNFYALRIYTKPFIYLMWIGCAMIFGAAMVGICLSLMRAKKDAKITIFT